MFNFDDTCNYFSGTTLENQRVYQYSSNYLNAKMTEKLKFRVWVYITNADI